MSSKKTLDRLLKNLVFKVDWLNRLKAKPEKFQTGNLNLLHIDIDYPEIRNSITDFDFEITLSKLEPLKSQIEYLLNSEVAFTKILHSIFLVKDLDGFEYASKTLLTDLNYLNEFIGTLINDVQENIPHEFYLNKTLKLSFFQQLVTWTGRNRQPFIEIPDDIDLEKISMQFYDMYMGNKLKTKYPIRFRWNKNEIYYVLNKIAETNKSMKSRKKFFENPLFLLKGEPIIDANLRKAIVKFKKDESSSKRFIDKYFKKSQEEI